MTMHSIKPEWDTPPNGDFASYVERLSAQQALQSGRAQAVHSAQVVQPRLPAGVAAGSAQAAAHRAAAAAKAASPTVALPPELVQLAAPFVGLLRIARMVLAFLAGVHALTLVLAGQGSWFALVVMGMLWWGMGLVVQAAATAGATAPPAAAVAERLRQVAQQRKTGNKK
jgi:hypothetical protein